MEKELEGKKYLLVLDDVWDDRREEWRRLYAFLRKGKGGSVVLATMRSKNVARATGARDSESHCLGELDEEDARCLFKRLAFRPEWQGDEAMERVGAEIFSMCARLPLVLWSIACTLSSKGGLSEWERVKKTMPERLKMEEREKANFMRVHKLSYDHLPSHLKMCFAYCALFPKDYEFDEQRLIHMWIAQGFVQQPVGDESLEDVGGRYFTELLNRSFFSTKREKGGRGETRVFHKMQDIMHDLAQYVAEGEEDLAVIDAGVQDTRPTSKRLRHVSLYNCIDNPMLSLDDPTHVRTLLISGSVNDESKFIEYICQNFTCLRVLDLHQICAMRKCIPSCIRELIYLRYLDLSKNRITYLPNSISRLKNLRYLDLSCNDLSDLPNYLSRLMNLRYLNLSRNTLSCLPDSITNLTNLQTLNLWCCEQLRELPIHFSELVSLRHLNIDGCDRLRHLPHGFEKMMASLVTLQVDYQFQRDAGIDEGEPSALWAKVENKDMMLIVHGYRGDESMGIPPFFRNLVEIQLEEFDKCIVLPAFSTLAHLKVLEIRSLPSLEYMEDGSSATSSLPPFFFPSLEKLKMISLPRLRGWLLNSSTVPETPSFPQLSFLELRDCRNLKAMPHILPGVLQELVVFRDHRSLMGQLLKSFKCAVAELSTIESDLEGFRLSSKALRISGCENLTSLSFVEGVSSSLERLCIKDCPKLRCLRGMGYLTSLEELEIRGCEGLGSWGEEESLDAWKGLGNSNDSLRSLTLERDSKLESLPRGIQYLTTLQQLEIEDFDNLTAVPEWIGHLAQLQKLEIWVCRSLTTLPKELCNLKVLQDLTIGDCGKAIKEKCEEQTGEYWHLIQYIPHRKIW